MVINWTKRERAMLRHMDIGFDFTSSLTDTQLEELYEIVPDYMLENTDTDDTHPDSDYNICEDIITKLARSMENSELL